MTENGFIFIASIILAVFGWGFKSLIIEPLRQSIDRLASSVDEINRNMQAISVKVNIHEEKIHRIDRQTASLVDRVQELEKCSIR